MLPERAATLAQQLRAVSEAFIALIEDIDDAHWQRVPGPGVWSPSKDAEHVADGNAMHQWAVRQALGQQPGPPPPIERKQLIAQRARDEVAVLLRQCTADSVRLIEGLTEEQLRRPMQTRRGDLGDLIERVLIGHITRHQREIERKLKAAKRVAARE